MLNRFLNIAPCLKNLRWSIGPSLVCVVQIQPNRFITTTTAWCRLQPGLPVQTPVESPLSRSILGVEPMTDITDHDLNAQSRALDPANDCSYDKDAYSQRQPKTGSLRISFVIPSRYYTENHDQDNDGVKTSTTGSRFSAVKYVWSSPLIRHISYRADFKTGDQDTARTVKEAKDRRRHILRNPTGNHDQDNDVDKVSTSMSRFSTRRESTSPEPSAHNFPIFQPYHPEHPKYVALSWRPWGNSTGNDDQDTDVDKFSSSWS